MVSQSLHTHAHAHMHIPGPAALFLWSFGKEGRGRNEEEVSDKQDSSLISPQSAWTLDSHSWKNADSSWSFYQLEITFTAGNFQYQSQGECTAWSCCGCHWILTGWLTWVSGRWHPDRTGWWGRAHKPFWNADSAEWWCRTQWSAPCLIPPAPPALTKNYNKNHKDVF